ncbi:hypothetical protein BC830DRAFT_1123908 [Chytriomyces sp. MP71]|nr:hypothetical protein BC830DRAFT_1123908 [Chytriomyces sp. MP71]
MPKQHSDPCAVASLSLALFAQREYCGVQSLASVFVAERILALHGFADSDDRRSLSVFLWGDRERWELEHIWTAIHGFVDSEDHGAASLVPLFRKLDSETLYAAIPFSTSKPYLPPSPLKTPSPITATPGNTATITTYVVLLKNTDSWAFHDIKVSADWDTERARLWSDSIEAAAVRYKADKSRADSGTPLPNSVDRDYWELYDLVELKNATRPESSQSMAAGSAMDEGTDDYWNSYENNLSRF